MLLGDNIALESEITSEGLAARIPIDLFHMFTADQIFDNVKVLLQDGYQQTIIDVDRGLDFFENPILSKIVPRL